MSDIQEKVLTISGVKVVFPCKPYPSQFGMMDKVIKGIERGQNCLLESPTGSGKSLALLCSALAWQNAQYEKLTKTQLVEEKGKNDCCCKTESKTSESESKYFKEDKVPHGASESIDRSMDTSNMSMTGKTNEVVQISDDDDDFRTESKFKTPVQKRRHVGISYEDSPTPGPAVGKEERSPVDQCGSCSCGASDTSIGKKQKVPKIYFGTRTHKQIAQITRELKRTAYHDVKMAILASREFTCVHPQVKKMKNKNEGCRERTDSKGPGCTYKDRSTWTFLHQHQLQQNGLSTAWDIEDFVGVCLTKKACPYFVTRNIREQADIIFCPYNYLMDPLVRSSMEINLKDQVVILDEAHNIEDSARDAASGTLTTEEIHNAVNNLEEIMNEPAAFSKFVEHSKLKTMLESLQKFTEESAEGLEQKGYDQAYKVWSGLDIAARLKAIGMGYENLAMFKNCLERVTAVEEQNEQALGRGKSQDTPKISSATQKTLELLLQVLDYMYRENMKYVEDFRLSVMKTVSYGSRRDTNNQWLNRRDRNRVSAPEVIFSLNFWCMNPAVAFSDFNNTRSVVLSSGTLSPMSSFSSELGAPFPLQLEANHVIKDSQVWVGALGDGPRGNKLRAVYKHMETYSFQDELGELILQICMTVPYGILCFLPSYRALETFTQRWKDTQLFSKISQRKVIMVEPRASDRTNFDSLIKRFYDVVSGDALNEEGFDGGEEVDGAVFFAVCRGKVSEGLDFADNNARAVITVGIPYPSIKDLQVQLKKQYNDKHRTQKGLLSGNEWYEIQAFRALNQALGRCIRHSKDWGALVMVDERFQKDKDKYCKGLSKWVRSKVRTFNSFPESLSSLGAFTQRMVKEMATEVEDTSLIPSTPASENRKSLTDSSNSTSPNVSDSSVTRMEVNQSTDVHSNPMTPMDKPYMCMAEGETPFKLFKQEPLNCSTPLTTKTSAGQHCDFASATVPNDNLMGNITSDGIVTQVKEEQENSSLQYHSIFKIASAKQKIKTENLPSPRKGSALTTSSTFTSAPTETTHQQPERSPGHIEMQHKLSAIISGKQTPAKILADKIKSASGDNMPVKRKALFKLAAQVTQTRESAVKGDNSDSNKSGEVTNTSQGQLSQKTSHITQEKTDTNPSMTTFPKEPNVCSTTSNITNLPNGRSAAEQNNALIISASKQSDDDTLLSGSDVIVTRRKSRRRKSLSKLSNQKRDEILKDFVDDTADNCVNTNPAIETSESEATLKRRPLPVVDVKSTENVTMSINKSYGSETRLSSSRKRSVNSLSVSKKRKVLADIDPDFQETPSKCPPNRISKFSSSEPKIQQELQCKHCSVSLLTTGEPVYLRQRVPECIKEILKAGSPQIMSLDNVELYEAGPLSVVSSAVNGMTLNAFWHQSSQCSLQYLQCRNCVSRHVDTVVGVRLLSDADVYSPLEQGQTWISTADVLCKTLSMEEVQQKTDPVKRVCRD